MPFTPLTLGAPAKFDRWRPTQLAAYYAATSAPDASNTWLMLPTGSGKTLLAFAIAATVGRTLILCSSRSQQDQYLRELSQLVDEGVLTDIRGQRNYPCRALDAQGQLRRFAFTAALTCDHGPCHYGVRCSLAGGGCDYFDAVRLAANPEVEIVVGNYAWWIAQGKSLRRGSLKEEPLGEFAAIICDEAHELHEELCRALTATLDPAMLMRLAGVALPRKAADHRDWKRWAGSAQSAVARTANDLRRNIAFGGLTSASASTSRDLRNLGDQLDSIVLMDEAVVTRERNRAGAECVVFRPVWASGSAGDLVYRAIPRRIFMSATIRPEHMRLCGAEGEFHEYPSDFPLAQRPIWLWHAEPAVKVRFGMGEGEERIWLSRIDAVLRTRMIDLGYKGIIHSVSYDRMRAILNGSRYRDRIITHRNSDDLPAALEELRSRDEGCVLLSPSVATAVDLPDDLCRFIIWAKLPFPPMKDEVMMRRRSEWPDWDGFLLATTFSQGVGRGNRHRRDWCEVIVVDDQSRWALNPNARRNYARFLTPTVTAAIRRSTTLPPPLTAECLGAAR